jgi:hypothetical protein
MKTSRKLYFNDDLKIFKIINGDPSCSKDLVLFLTNNKYNGGNISVSFFFPFSITQDGEENDEKEKLKYNKYEFIISSFGEYSLKNKNSEFKLIDNDYSVMWSALISFYEKQGHDILINSVAETIFEMYINVEEFK